MKGRVFIFPLALLAFWFTVAEGQSMKGFISIDCGRPKGPAYISVYEGKPYISDSEFVDTSQSETHNAYTAENDPFSILRSFPNGIRNCYRITVIQGNKYLVRASFVYRNYDGREEYPEFDLYIGVNFWTTVNLAAVRNYDIVMVAISDSLSICLVNTNKGVPFISAIDVRPLADGLYSEANPSQSLALLSSRLDFGGKDYVYPDDIYDRFWYGDSNRDPSLSVYNTSEPITTSPFDEPYRVMQSLISPNTTTGDLNFTYTITPRPRGVCPSTRAYFVLYFAELERLLPNESRILHVSVNGILIPEEIIPKYLSTTAFEQSISFSGDQLKISVESTSKSTKPPIINALEVYKIINMTCQSETRAADVDAMIDIKSLFNVKNNWNGDPCAPKAFIWEGLNCSYDGSNPLVISLNLSSSDLTGGIPVSLSNLSALQYLDLSSNSLSGGIPDVFSELSQLKVLNLANNSLSGLIPNVLLYMSARGQLDLRTEGNPNLYRKSEICEDQSRKNSKYVVIVVVSCIVVVVLLALVLIVIWRYRRNGSTVSLSGLQNKHHLSTLHSDGIHFTFNEVVRITDNFVRPIGRGGFGPVYHGMCKNDVQVAVKMLSHSSLQGVKEFQTEAMLLTRIHHKKLVTLIGYCNDGIDHLALVYEYMEGGSLQENLSVSTGRPPLSWRDRLRIAFDAAQGLEYLHKGCRPSIVHRDVKTSNILLTKKLEARIADFGLSKMFQDEEFTHMSTRVVGTPGYLDPDKYNITNQLNERSDVYSFGVVLMELVTGLPAIIRSGENIHITHWIQQRLARGDVREVVDKRIQEENYDINSVWKLVDIANACTNLNSLQRPDISEVVAALKECLEVIVVYEKRVNQDLETNVSYEMTPLNDSSMVCPGTR